MPPAPREDDPGTRHDSCHLPPAALIIPDIQLPFSTPPPRSDADHLRTHALAWAQRTA